jgi:hypothetical protein
MNGAGLLRMLLSGNINNGSFAEQDSGLNAPRLRHKRLAV